MDGIQNGFRITDTPPTAMVETNNYASATCREHRSLVEKQIRAELTEGRYVKTTEKPVIVSALGAIPKSDGGIRLIHDASRPAGTSLNDHVLFDQKLRFQSLEDAVQLLAPGVYLAKLDLKSAYRSVRIHPSDWQACGIKWTFDGDTDPTYMIDTALPFGSRLAPKHFHRLTQAVRRMMARLGFTGIVAYLDDFLIVETTFERCLQAQNTLISLLRTLGFSIAWHKVEGPQRILTFLGVNIDTVHCHLELPRDKLDDFHKVIKEALACKRMSLRQLQVLAGKLNWASAVVRGGRSYLRRVLDAMRPLRNTHHKALIPPPMKEDLEWWDRFLHLFNGKSFFPTATRWVNIYVDASTKGGGMVWDRDWAYVNWHSDVPEMAEAHINIKEIMAITWAVRRWAPYWANASVTVHTDNITARAAFTKGSVRSQAAMPYIREVFWWAALFNFKLRAVHIPGKLNIAADAASRLHSDWAHHELWSYLGLAKPLPLPLAMYYHLNHMSVGSLCAVLPQVQRTCPSS